MVCLLHTATILICWPPAACTSPPAGPPNPHPPPPPPTHPANPRTPLGQNAGLKSLSYQASGSTAITGGPDTELLEEELAQQAQQAVVGAAHAAPGLVSLLVRPRIDIVSKDKLVASKGKFITVTGGRLP